MPRTHVKKSGTKTKVIILVLERQTGGSLGLTGQAVQLTIGLLGQWEILPQKEEEKGVAGQRSNWGRHLRLPDLWSPDPQFHVWIFTTHSKWQDLILNNAGTSEEKQVRANSAQAAHSEFRTLIASSPNMQQPVQADNVCRNSCVAGSKKAG